MKERIKNLLSTHRQVAIFLTVFITAQLFIIAAKWGRPLIWDSNVYVGMGKVIFSGWQYGLWESFRPLVLPAVSGFMWLIGLPMRNFPRIIGLVFAVAGLLVFHRYTSEFGSRQKAITGTLMLGSVFLFLKYSSYFLTGILASVFVIAALYMVGRENFYIAGILSSLAFLTRFPAALVGPSVALFFLIQFYSDREIRTLIEKSAWYAGGVLTLAVPFLLLNQVMYGEVLHPLVSGALIPAGNPEKYMFGFWYVLESFKSGYFLLTSLMLLTPVGIYSAVKRDSRSILPAVTLAVFYGFFSVYPHKLVRFMVLLVPLFAYFAAEAVTFLGEILQDQYSLVSTDMLHLGFRAVFVLGMILGSYGLYDVNTWENTDRQKFLEESSEVLNGTVVSNTPEIVPYADFRYIPVRPENLKSENMLDINSCTSKLDTGFCKVSQEEIDYIVVSTRSWYCTPAIENCQGKIDSFESQVKKVFEVKYNLSGPKSNYTIYRRE